jgi:Subtilase family.
MKPEIAAPGRYMIAAVPTSGVLYSQRPASVTSPGYMQLSGTSFAAPVVAGAAAMLLGQHPSWTPDQVKGALMLSASKQPLVTQGQLGVGEVNISAARYLRQSPPNPNAALEQFTGASADGTRVFNAAAWADAARSDAAGLTRPGATRRGLTRPGLTQHGPLQHGLTQHGHRSPGPQRPGRDAAWSDAAWADAAWGGQRG